MAEKSPFLFWYQNESNWLMFLTDVFGEKTQLSHWLVFLSLVALIRPLLRRSDGANIIHTVKTTWPSQDAIFELLALFPNLRGGALLRRPMFKKAVPRDPVRYIRIFDVMSEVNYILLSRKRRRFS